MKVVSTVAIAIAVAMFASMWSHGAPRATAANILTNPTFDTDISGWSISFGRQSRTPRRQETRPVRPASPPPRLETWRRA